MKVKKRREVQGLKTGRIELQEFLSVFICLVVITERCNLLGGLERVKNTSISTEKRRSAKGSITSTPVKTIKLATARHLGTEEMPKISSYDSDLYILQVG